MERKSSCCYKYPSTDKTSGIFGELRTLKTTYPHIKVLASLGGWSYSYYFADIGNTAEAREGFAGACNQLLTSFSDVFDGVDLDWEFPVTGGDGGVEHYANDADNLTSLCATIRSTIGTGKLLTIAAAQNYKEIANQFTVGLKDSLDFINIMTYDYSGGSWSPRTGMNSPLYSSGDTNDPLYSSTDGKYMVVDEAIKVFVNTIGIPSSQIVMGIPFYGRTFAGVTNANNGLFQSHTGVGLGSFENGAVDFNDIVDGFKSHDYLDLTGTTWTGKGGYTRYWNDNTKTPYLFNGSTFISYDDTESIAIKSQYILDNNLAGGMIWELDSDLRYDSATEPYMLINTIDTTFKADDSNVKIDGYVKLNSAGLQSVSIKIYNQTTDSTSTVTTDSNGYYSIFVAKNINYVITPEKTNYTFSPVNISINNITQAYTASDIIATSSLALYSISGIAKDSNDNPVSNVIFTLSGDKTGSMTTDADGDFIFSNIIEGSTVSVTATKEGYTVTPTSYTFLNLSSNQTDKNFVITQKVKYSISGKVKDANNALIPGVVLNLTGDTIATFTTLANGEFSFSDIVAGSTITVTASKTGYVFTPARYSFSSLSANQTDKNFVISAKPVFTFTPLPDRVIVGYWHNWDNASAPFIALKDVKNTKFNVCIVSFIETQNSDGYTPIFTPDAVHYPDEATFKAEIQELKAAGIPVLISIGGQNGHVFLDTVAHKTTFVEGVKAIVDEYGFDGIDIDYEGGSMTAFIPPSNSLEYADIIDNELKNGIDAIREIYEYFGQGFIITAAPEMNYVFPGGTYPLTGQFLPVLHNIRDILSFVHVQLYNGGINGNPDVDGLPRWYQTCTSTDEEADLIDAATDLLLKGFKLKNGSTLAFPALRQDQVAIGLPASPSAANSGYVSTTILNRSLDYLTKGTKHSSLSYSLQGGTYPNLRGLMTWSINWDASTNGGTTSYEYSNNAYNYFSGIEIILPTKYKISGKIKNASGTYLSGMTVKLLLNNLTYATVTTDSNGTFEFNEVLNNSYAVSIISNDSYTGKNISVQLNSADVNLQDATLTAIDIKHSINGKILDTSNNNLSSILVKLVKDNVTISSTTTDAAGNYKFENMSSDDDYFIQVPNTDLYIGSSLYIASLDTNLIVEDIQLSSIISIVKYTISGTILDASNNKLSGISVTLLNNDNIIATTLTNSEGYYSFSDILPNTDYIIKIPNQSVYLQKDIILNNLSGNVSVEDVVLIKNISQYTISGTIFNASNNNLSNITINLFKNNILIDIATSDGNGAFTFTSLYPNYNYVLEIVPRNTYIKQYVNITNLEANILVYTTLNKKSSIKGYIKDLFNRPIENIQLYIDVSANSTTNSQSISNKKTNALKEISYNFTNSDGYFEFNNLSNNIKYKISLQKDGYTFNPNEFITTSSNDDTITNITTSFTVASDNTRKFVVYPNPCYINQNGKIIFDNISSSSIASVSIYDIRGILVKTLEYNDEIEKTGTNLYRAIWNCDTKSGSYVASGIYIAIIKGSSKITRKIAII